ncbi:MAG: Uma2 family endonuclease [Dehalococcoidia bacterium]|nr:Uma2 family endonuclease [Dehalococcoidia bacterium]
MTAPTVEKLLTAEEFAALPERRDGRKVELHRGRVVLMAPVGPDHGERATKLARRLDDYASAHQLGRVRVETGYWMGSNPDHVFAPDVSFVTEARAVRETIRHGFVEQPPDIAIEVVSKNDSDVDVATKVADYLSAGVSRVWVVRPALRSITVHRPNGDAHTYSAADSLSSDDAAFGTPGFTLPLREIFRPGG